MELIASPTSPDAAKRDPRVLDSPNRRAGASPGVNIAPGSDDDGWIVPPPVVLQDGTAIQLYKDGEALHAAYNAIANAERRICLEVYIFADDDTGKAFADLLIKKAQQGLFVYVIYDSFGSMQSNRQMFRDMQRFGVRMRQFHPIRPWECQYGWRPANRDHRKLLVVDDQLAGMGGLNVGREYAGSWVIDVGSQPTDFWRDNAIGIRGPGAMQLLKSFARMWKYATSAGPITRAEYTYNLNGADGELGLLASVPTMNSPLRPFLLGLLNGAKRNIDMTMAYFAPDDDLTNSLIRAAKRGVKVRLMLPARSDVKILLTAARSFYECLMDVGVEIYERQSVVLHAKTMCIDHETTIVGSANLDHRSVELNCELSAIIRNKELGRQMRDLFENDICYAIRVDRKKWRHRPWRDRLGQWCVSRFRYLL
ncbi:MAG TPA: phospholipase D-like domain-containing protein [Tepidisphaeraceae bacterium]|jgi:cardiolipin synthase|nr:phospholipase D-like domain-containing protein [Tepidisphaeraceae bacterium]